MKEILGAMFDHVNEEIIPDRGMVPLLCGEDEEGFIAAYAYENDEGEFIARLENIASYRPGRGSEMMTDFISRCRDAGYAAIEAVVFPLLDNPRFFQYQRLLRWYMKFGFSYADEADAVAAEEILSQPGEIRVKEYCEELHHPKMVLRLE